MKISRSIGLAVVAALALMAAASASSASANQTTLCKSNSLSYCPESERYASGTTFSASTEEVRLQFIPGKPKRDMVCEESTIEGKTTATSGEPLTGEVTGWNLSACYTEEGSECTAEGASGVPASASISRTASGNGTMSLKGSPTEIRWRVKCGSTLDCFYKFNPTLTVEGGNPAKLTIDATMKSEGPFCIYTSATFKATYTVNSPQPLYVQGTEAEENEAQGSVFCKGGKYGFQEPCEEANIYPSGTEFAAELVPGTEAEFASTASWKCKGSSFSGKTTAEKGLPASISSFAFNECSAPLIGTCTWSAENLPYSTTFEVNQETKVRQMNVSKFKQHFACGGLNCAVVPQSLHFTFSGGSPAGVEVSQTVPLEGSACPVSTYLFKAKYQFSEPSPLYLVYNE